MGDASGCGVFTTAIAPVTLNEWSVLLSVGAVSLFIYLWVFVQVPGVRYNRIDCGCAKQVFSLTYLTKSKP